MRAIRFGIIGCGLMGREFASAVARWCHLPQMEVRPELVAVASGHLASTEWFTRNFASIRQATEDWREVMANPAVEAVYIAVPNHLHREIYSAAIMAGKHLMGEKPFGIDQPACQAILDCLGNQQDVFVRCASQFPFFPAVQRIGRMIEQQAFGRILEVNSGFLHSSDLDANKPLNWKRMVEFNGDYGVLGDLGMHVCHVPFRAGWRPRNVRAILSDIVPERPDGRGGMARCSTWDNATLLCEAEVPGGERFPWTIRTQRISPGQKNTWYLEILGARASARYSTRDPNGLDLLEYTGGEQSWRRLDLGQAVAFPSITGGIFEFGFSDAILQMWAAFVTELTGGPLPGRFAGCALPEEAGLSHQLFTAALDSQRRCATVSLD